MRFIHQPLNQPPKPSVCSPIISATSLIGISAASSTTIASNKSVKPLSPLAHGPRSTAHHASGSSPADRCHQSHRYWKELRCRQRVFHRIVSWTLRPAGRATQTHVVMVHSISIWAGFPPKLLETICQPVPWSQSAASISAFATHTPFWHLRSVKRALPRLFSKPPKTGALKLAKCGLSLCVTHSEQRSARFVD